jgi:hypothetical protein
VSGSRLLSCVILSKKACKLFLVLVHACTIHIDAASLVVAGNPAVKVGPDRIRAAAIADGQRHRHWVRSLGQLAL